MRLRYLTNLEDPCPRPYIEKTAWLEVTGAIWAAGPMVGLCFTESSDRNAKENFSPIDPRSVLDRVVALPISEWNYTNTPTRHLGPMAQDFYGAFGVGPDDKHITTLDADGVALAAIQGLNQKLEDQVKAKDARIATLEKDVAELGKARDAQIDALEKDMAELKSAVKRLLEQARDPGAIRSL